jgi:hypothetical protein
VLDVLHGDAQLLACLVLDDPHGHKPVEFLGQPAGRAHPVERFIGPVVGVHADRSVSFEQQQPAGGGQMGGEAPDIVNGALGDHETHPNTLCAGTGKLG